MSEPSGSGIRTLARIVALACAFIPVARSGAAAQSNGDLGAFSALMVSPAGALPPLARDAGGALPSRTDISLRYGGWSYDSDDGVHNNVGMTIARRLGGSRTTLAFTGAYLSLDCACSVWLSTGLALRSILWSGARNSGERPGISAHVAIEEKVGAARYSGSGGATALAASGALDLGVAIPLFAGTRMAASVFPGVGAGRINSIDQTASGSRPMIGAAVSWMLGRGIALDGGIQRVVLTGGPTQAGGGISWRGR